MLALPIHIGVVGRGYYREGSGAIHIREVTCSGSERNITNCTYINNTLVTSHAYDVAVECQKGQCFEVYTHSAFSCASVGDDIKAGDIRLVPGSYLWQGLVEIFLDGVWGKINYISPNAARVVCRQLGYNTYGNLLPSTLARGK